MKKLPPPPPPTLYRLYTPENSAIQKLSLIIITSLLTKFFVFVYLKNLMKVYRLTHQLRLSSDTSILRFPSVCMHLLSQKSSSYAVLSVWNSLPFKVRSSNTLTSFEPLKSHLFKLSYWMCVCVCKRKFVLTVLLVLWFVMGYVFQFGEIARERVYY